MNIDTYNEHMQGIIDALREQARRIRQLESVQMPVGGGTGNHNILSATHSDSEIQAVSEGSMIYGNKTPLWDELLIGALGEVLTSDGSVPVWAAPTAVAHNFLSATHTDTTPAAATRGDIVTAQGAAPNTKWAILAKGALSGSIVTCNANDVLWSAWALSGTAAQTYTFPPSSATLVGGTGALGRVAYWSAVNTLSSDAVFTYNTIGKELGVNVALPGHTLDVGGKVGISGVQTVYNAGASAAFTGTLYFGNGGGALSHTGGLEAYYITAVGSNAALSNTIGYGNTAVGSDSLYTCTTGYLNTGVGYQSLQYALGGYSNTAVGYRALRRITSGQSNTAVGTFAGEFTAALAANQTTTLSTYIGYDTRSSADGVTNEMVIGHTAVGKGSNTTTIGTATTTDAWLFGNHLIEDQHYVGIFGNVRIIFDGTSENLDNVLNDAAGASELRILNNALTPIVTFASNGGGYIYGNLLIGNRNGGTLVADTLLTANRTADVDNSWVGSRPQDTLAVVGTDAQIKIVAEDLATWGASLAFAQYDLSAGTHFENAWGIARQTNGDGTGDGSLRFLYGTNTDPSSNTAMVAILPTGYVGINATTPEMRLHVRGDNALPATSGTAQTGGRIRVGASASNGVLDIGGYNATQWMQATNRTDLSLLYDILLNPNGGNILVGTATASGGTATRTLMFGDNAGDPSPGVNTAGVYAKDVGGTVETFAVDEAGNVNQLTPHNYTMIEPIYGVLHWAEYQANLYAGIEKTYDMERALLDLEQLTGNKYIHTRKIRKHPKPAKVPDWLYALK